MFKEIGLLLKSLTAKDEKIKDLIAACRVEMRSARNKNATSQSMFNAISSTEQHLNEILDEPHTNNNGQSQN